MAGRVRTGSVVKACVTVVGFFVFERSARAALCTQCPYGTAHPGFTGMLLPKRPGKEGKRRASEQQRGFGSQTSLLRFFFFFFFARCQGLTAPASVLKD